MHSRVLLRLTCCACASLSACGGGGGAAADEFHLVEISVAEGTTWQINRPIRLVFDRDVDFASVDMNTVHVAREDGVPATATIHADGPRAIVFQPTCPTLEDYSDAGLTPGGVRYRLDLPSGTSGGSSVRAVDGTVLAESYGVRFVTPISTDPAELFLDGRPGPPAAVVRTDPSELDASYLELGGDPAQRAYFQPRVQVDPELGADLPAGFAAGLNLYSHLASRIAVVVVLDQPVNPSAASVSADTVRLEYRDAAGDWHGLAHTVELSANCTGAGARVRLEPVGILPQNRQVRIVLTQEFADIIGEQNIVPLTVGAFLVSTAHDPGGSVPGDGADDLREEFAFGGDAAGSLEDTESSLVEPRAVWGEDGALSANFAFDGTGGPGGDFDWEIGNDPPGAAELIFLDTTFSLITNAQQTTQQLVIGGRVDLRNLTIKANGKLVVLGPNPCRILVSGSARIDGVILSKGGSRDDVTTLGTAQIPEPGAAGQAGGGRGGAGSPFTTQSDPVGEDGYGAFNDPHLGGYGGETGYNPLSEPEGFRRAGGGGGGVFGRDVLRPAGIVPGYTNPDGCPDQSMIGLDAEPGFRGAPTAGGASHLGQQPLGGLPGHGPFFDAHDDNDFWGTMRKVDGTVVHGELTSVWAGAGGGGGGDSITAATFPPGYYDPSADEKGCGGGGGGGSITILALGDIVLGPGGRIDVGGGNGGGGEDQFPVKRIAGGSGGGSGGHLVLQTASQIDLSECTSAPGFEGGLFAPGGQGGEGANAFGGARGGILTAIHLDALPPNSYPNDSAPCGVAQGVAGYDYDNEVGNGDPANVVVCCGGDGGPGIIQLHAPTLADILPPATAGDSIFTVCKPPPLGSTPPTGVPTLARISDPAQWDRLLPIFGRKSEALSKWIPLGGASVSADDALDEPEVVRFAFDGTASDGTIETSGSGASASVADLPPIFAGTIAPGTTPPYVAADARTVVFDGSAFADDVYLRNPRLLERFELRIGSAGSGSEFEVGAASYEPVSGELRMTVSAGGEPLDLVDPGDPVLVRPRFFRVVTEGALDSLPDSSRIVVEFQATTATPQGEPDVGAASAWKADVRQLDPNRGTNPDYRFLRFHVAFDISADGSPLGFDTPVPSLDFFRVSLRF